MGVGGDHASAAIEQDVAERSKLIFDGRSKQPQRPHVEEEVQPAAVQEHVRKKGKVREAAEIAERGGCKVARRDERELHEELLQLLRGETDLHQKDCAIDANQGAGDEGGRAGRGRCLKREHGIGLYACLPVPGRPLPDRGSVSGSRPVQAMAWWRSMVSRSRRSSGWRRSAAG